MQTTRTGDLSDAAVVGRCREGDDDAWAELVERFARYVYAIATQAFRLDSHEAEDVFQDVFARVYERLETLRSDDAVRPWIGQMTRNCCLDRIRAADREIAVEDVDEQAADDTIARLDEAVAVRDALGTLGADCREVLDRFFCRDESYRTIGEALGLPPGTIASRISRCLGKLRSAYEGRNPAGSASSDQVSE
jgi:RNA polymerase sigma factor (sigma-70 family)